MGEALNQPLDGDVLVAAFEAISCLDAAEKEVVIAVLDSLLLRHDARRWTSREKAS